MDAVSGAVGSRQPVEATPCFVLESAGWEKKGLTCLEPAGNEEASVLPRETVKTNSRSAPLQPPQAAPHGSGWGWMGSHERLLVSQLLSAGVRGSLILQVVDGTWTGQDEGWPRDQPVPPGAKVDISRWAPCAEGCGGRWPAGLGSFGATLEGTRGRQEVGRAPFGRRPLGTRSI